MKKNRRPGRDQRSHGRSQGRPEGRHDERLYGLHSVQEVLQAGRRKVLAIEAPMETQDPDILEVLRFAQRQGIAVQRHAKLRGDEVIAAVVGPYPYVEWKTLLESEPPLVVACDQIQDPQNLGAILRSAHAFGAGGVLLTEHHSSAVTEAVSRASAGASEHLPIARVTNLGRVLDAFKEKRYWIAVAAASPAKKMQDIPDPPLVLVVGNEHHGVRQGITESADLTIGIPMQHDFDSLNVSVATGILLYEIAKRTSVR